MNQTVMTVAALLPAVSFKIDQTTPKKTDPILESVIY